VQRKTALTDLLVLKQVSSSLK